MKVKTSELTGRALDWAVAKAKGGYCLDPGPRMLATYGFDGSGCPTGVFSPSTNWDQGGPIIEREKISLDQREGEPCRAFKGTPVRHEFVAFSPESAPLVAAMRCYVASKLGDTVEVPEELC